MTQLIKWTFRCFIFLAFLVVSPGKVRAGIAENCDSLVMSGIQNMFAKKYSRALELLTEAQIIAKDNRLYRQQFLATNNIGLTYYFMFDYGEALHNYLEAYTIALQQKEPTQEMSVLNNIAVLYSKEKNYDKANEYFQKAYDIAKDVNSRSRIGLYAANLGMLSNETNDLEKARNYLDEAIPFLDKDPKTLLNAKVAMAQNHFREGKTREAASMAEGLLVQAIDSGYLDEKTEINILLAKAALKEHELSGATKYAYDALLNNEDLETKMQIYAILSGISFSNQEYNLSLQFKDSVIHLQDTANKIKNSRLFENSKLKFELQNSQHTLELNQSTLASQRKIIYSILALVIVIVIFVSWFLRNKAAKNRQREMIAETNRKIAVLELEKEKSEHLLLEKQLQEKETTALLEQERLKNEIELKNRTLSAKALFLSGRNELVEQVIAALVKIPDLSKNENLLKHIVNLKEHLKKGDEWEDFSTHFEQVNQHFLTSLKNNHPSLTANDIRFASYIYMNLRTKEIASLLNITPEGCRKRKERIAKKMELPSETTLFDYLSNL